jgi:hypothetical protein
MTITGKKLWGSRDDQASWVSSELVHEIDYQSAIAVSTLNRDSC